MMYYGHLLEQWSLEMDLIKDLELFMKKEMQRVGINPSNTNLLEPYRLKDICSLNEQFDDEQYEQIREAHISTLIQTENDKCYGFLGGGYMSDGSSGEAVRNEFFWNNRLKICEDVIRRNMTSILQVIREQCNYKGYTYNIKLMGMPVSPNNINVIETKTQMGIELLLSESRVRVFKIEDELKYIYENEEMDSGN